jgi:membrane associated rhomboid family serine protease
MIRLTDVVKNLLIINVLLFFIVQARLIPIPNLLEYFTLYSFDTGNFKPYQIVTHMFMHFDIRHLLFNMLLLFFIGPAVEQTLGPQRFLFLYFTAGVVSAVAQLLLSSHFNAVGASGALYGVLTAFAAMFPNMKLMIFPLPFEIKAKYLVGAYVVYDLYQGVMAANTGIAHFAHFGGAIAGFLLIYYWNLLNLR